MSSSKVQTIIPLTPVEQALLIATLSGEGIGGLLQAQCELHGVVDKERLGKAWRSTIERHEAMRSSVIWEKIEHPVQVVRQEFEEDIEFIDWSDAGDDFDSRFAEARSKDMEIPLDLTSSSPMRLKIFKRSDDLHQLLWTCHHIFLDGWSASIVLRDLVAAYSRGDNPIEGRKASLLDYKQWIAQQDPSPAADFWRGLLDGTEAPTLVSDVILPDKETATLHAASGPEEMESLAAAAKNSGLTIATLSHGAWALVLGALTQSQAVFFGTTASGRSAPMVGLSETAGMFATVIPVLARLEEDLNAAEWLAGFQRSLAKMRQFEVFGETALASAIEANSQMFDSLLVFENIPDITLDDYELSIAKYRSGIVSAYPVTLAVRPGKCLEADLIYRKGLVSERLAEWCLNEFHAVLRAFSNEMSCRTDKIIGGLNPPPTAAPALRSPNTPEPDMLTRLELELQLMWEEVLGRRHIGREEDFFQVGGRSLAAVRMFTMIKDRLGINLSPVLLLEYPTIASLGAFIEENKEISGKRSTLVPLRRDGARRPLFCLHSGGGHVMFYRPLVNHLPKDQPVYGIEPVGIDGVEQQIGTVREMAAHHINEITKVQPRGPYSFLGYCFSSTLAIEIARQLKEKGETLGCVIVVDSPPMHLDVNVDETPAIGERARSYLRLLADSNWKEIAYRLRYKLRTLKWKFEKTAPHSEDQSWLPADPTLADSQEVLAQAFKDYQWEPFDADLTLIMAGPVEIRPWSRVIIKQWETLADGTLDVHFVNADHATIFEEPDVANLAEAIDKCLAEQSSP